MPETQPTSRDRLLDVGRTLFWRRGYHDVGLLEILRTAEVPKGSFYHHFTSKEGFALEVIDAFARDSLAELDAALAVPGTPAERLLGYFRAQRSRYGDNGCCAGCLLGNFGQELADSNDLFRQRVEGHMRGVVERFAAVLAEGVGESGAVDPATTAEMLLTGWHGALLRMKVHKRLEPIDTFLRFHFGDQAGLSH